METEQKLNFKVVFNCSCCDGNNKNVTFYLLIEIFYQYINWWNDLNLDIRCLESIGSFKKVLFSFYNVASYNATYDFAVDRFNAVFHTRLPSET